MIYSEQICVVCCHKYLVKTQECNRFLDRLNFPIQHLLELTVADTLPVDDNLHRQLALVAFVECFKHSFRSVDQIFHNVCGVLVGPLLGSELGSVLRKFWVDGAHDGGHGFTCVVRAGRVTSREQRGRELVGRRREIADGQGIVGECLGRIGVVEDEGVCYLHGPGQGA